MSLDKTLETSANSRYRNKKNLKKNWRKGDNILRTVVLKRVKKIDGSEQELDDNALVLRRLN